MKLPLFVTNGANPDAIPKDILVYNTSGHTDNELLIVYQKATTDRLLSSDFFSPLLFARDNDGPNCASGEVACQNSCIPKGADCCGGTFYCNAGSYCTKDGCCQDGSVCGSQNKCEGDQETCGSGCMPKGSTCCGGSYCDAGSVCSKDNTCGQSSSSSSKPSVAVQTAQSDKTTTTKSATADKPTSSAEPTTSDPPTSTSARPKTTTSDKPSTSTKPASKTQPTTSSQPSTSSAKQTTQSLSTTSTTESSSTTTSTETSESSTSSSTISTETSLIVTSTDAQDFSQALQTAIPTSAQADPEAICFLASGHASQYTTPAWYTALPSDLQSYYASATVDASATAHCTATNAPAQPSVPGSALPGPTVGAIIGASAAFAGLVTLLILLIRSGKIPWLAGRKADNTDDTSDGAELIPVREKANKHWSFDNGTTGGIVAPPPTFSHDNRSYASPSANPTGRQERVSRGSQVSDYQWPMTPASAASLARSSLQPSPVSNQSRFTPPPSFGAEWLPPKDGRAI